MKKLLFSLSTLVLASGFVAKAGDTLKVQTFTFDTTARSGMFAFPNDPTQKYEKVIMQYSLRCKGGKVSTSGSPEQGCGQWDYNCYTYLVDSSRVDSFKTARPSYDILNFSGTKFRYTNQTINNYIKYIQKQTTVNAITTPTNVTVGQNTSNLGWLGGIEKASKIQVLWKASELTAAGLTAGPISALWVDVSTLGGSLKQLRLKLKDTTLTSLSAASPLLSGFQEVYYLNTTIPGTGIQKLIFNTPFNWDGTSSIVVEMSYTNNNAILTDSISGADAGFNATIIAKENDYGLTFIGGSGQVVQLGKNITGAQPRTIEGWAYVKSFNDGGIWDAGAKGNNGGDFSFRTNNGNPNSWRVQTWGSGFDFDVTLPNSIGAWHHYAMVYDGKNLMLYYDGVLIHSQAETLNTLSSTFSLGTWSGTTFDGSIDDIRVWDTVISPSTIKDWMTRKLTTAHPNYSHLKAYYAMDENQGAKLIDATGQNAAGTIINDPAWALFKGNSMIKRFTESAKRPYVTFAQGNYQITNKDTAVYDTISVKPTRVIAYKLNGTDVQIIDTTYKTAAMGYSYTQSENGTKLDSTKIAAQDSLFITQLNYYAKQPERVELINFITPYGINLNLNELIGKTWEFDVTDYLPVLKGNKFLNIPEANTQEDMDIRFLFIKGTPPRDVKAIHQIWPNGSTNGEVGYNAITTDQMFEPRNITLDPTAKSFKIRSQISGHGQDGEFTPKEHYITLNPGSHKEAWNVWRVCGENPIYPQGGTWVYDRAGWCPGRAVDVKETEITPWVTPGQNITLDYGMTDVYPGSGDWNYRVNNQLVIYSDANFTVDASIEYIKNPSTRVEFTRSNPMCSNPIVVIKNTGSTTLTSLVITYGLTSGTMKTYNWTGSLAFLQTAEVALPQIDWSVAQSGQFEATISQPNGQADQYADNNKSVSSFVKPALYPAKLIVALRTNLHGYENRLTLTNNTNGDTVLVRENLPNNKQYNDTLKLGTGCYTIRLTDSGGDGLSFFANTAQGNGSLLLKNGDTKAIINNFVSDFGNFTSLEFFVTDATYNAINPAVINLELSLDVFPNPVSQGEQLWIKTNLPTFAKANLYIYDVLGRIVTTQPLALLENNAPIAIDIQQLKSGIYQAVLQYGEQHISQKFSVSK